MILGPGALSMGQMSGCSRACLIEKPQGSDNPVMPLFRSRKHWQRLSSDKGFKTSRPVSHTMRQFIRLVPSYEDRFSPGFGYYTLPALIIIWWLYFHAKYVYLDETPSQLLICELEWRVCCCCIFNGIAFLALLWNLFLVDVGDLIYQVISQFDRLVFGFEILELFNLNSAF